MSSRFLLRSSVVLSVGLAATLLLTGCGTSKSEVGSTATTQTSAGSSQAPTTAATPSASATVSQANGDSDAGASTGTQPQLTSGYDARTAELAVNSYFDDIYTHQLQKAATLFYIQNPGNPNPMYENKYFVALNKAKLDTYTVTGSQYDSSSEETLVRVHYTLQGDNTQHIVDISVRENQLESRWYITTTNGGAFDTSP